MIAIALGPVADAQSNDSTEVFSESGSHKLRLEGSGFEEVAAAFYQMKGSEAVLLWRTNLATAGFASVTVRGFHAAVAPDGAGVFIENRSAPVPWVLAFFNASGSATFFGAEDVLNRRSPGTAPVQPFRPITLAALTNLAPEQVFQAFTDLREQANLPHTAAAFWEGAASWSFFDMSGNRPFYCVWLGLSGDWFAFDARSGMPTEPDSALKSKWTDRLRRSALRIIRERQSGAAKELLNRAREAVEGMLGRSRSSIGTSRMESEEVLETAYRVIARLGNATDRPILEVLLASKDFESSTGPENSSSSSPRRQMSFVASCPDRRLADPLLAYWDGKVPWGTESESPFGFHDYFYLGNIFCAVELPFPPTGGELWVYLFPADWGRDEWRTKGPSLALHREFQSALSMGPRMSGMGFFTGPGTTRSEELSGHAKCTFAGLTPGSYRLRAAWIRRQGVSKGMSSVLLPQAGDYESEGSESFQVVAGATLEIPALVCTNRMGSEAGPYLGDDAQVVAEQLKQQEESADGVDDSSGEAVQASRVVSKQWTPPPGTNKPDRPVQLVRVTFERNEYRAGWPRLNQDNHMLTVWWKGRGSQQDLEGPPFSIVDDHGCRYPLTSYTAGFSGGGTSSENGVSWTHFPRRQISFKLRAEVSSNQTVEFVIPNLAGRVTNAWTAERFSTAYELSGGVKAVFKGFKPARLSPDVRFESGTSAMDWRVRSALVRDPTGNEAESVGDLECRKEPVIQVSAKVIRSQKSNFGEDEQWTIAGLIVPGPGEFTILDRSNKLQGVKVQVLAFAGTGEITYSNGVPVSAVAQIDTGAVSATERYAQVTTTRHGRRRSEPPVFIKADDRMDPFGVGPIPMPRVVSRVAHIAVRLSGLSSKHVFYLIGGPEISAEASRPARWHSPFGDSDYAQSGDIYFLPLPASARRGRVTVKLVVQKERTIEWFVENPAAADESTGKKAL